MLAEITHGSPEKATLAPNMTWRASSQDDGAAASSAGDVAGPAAGGVRSNAQALNSQQLEALHAQTESQTRLLQSLLAQSGVGSPFPLAQSLLDIALHKLVAEDHPQCFLEMFALTAVDAAGRRQTVPVRLLPLLSGVAQTAALSLLASLHSG